MTSAPPPPDAPGPLPDLLALDELHVFVNGLDPLPAWVACALVGAGVCLIDVADPQPVTRSDITRGPYPAEVEGQPRELALRGVLRRRSPRCVPLTAPELFPSAALPGTVALNAWSVAGDLVTDLTAPPAPPLDPALPTLTVVTDGASALRWPTTPWEHRPCRECLAEAARSARRAVRDVVPDAVASPPLPTGDSPLAAITRTRAAGEIAALLLAAGLGLDTTTAHSTPEPRTPGAIDRAPAAARAAPGARTPGCDDPAPRGSAPTVPGSAPGTSGGRTPAGAVPAAGDAETSAAEVNEPRGPGPLPPGPCGPVMHRGLLVRELPPNPQCLCSLAFAVL